MTTATALQTVPTYTPTDAETKLIAALYEDERTGKLPPGLVAQIECIVLRKLNGITPMINSETRARLDARAKEFGVTPTF